MSKLRPLIEEPHVHSAESGVQPGTPIQVTQPPSPESQRPRLLDRVRDALRIRRYSLATEKAYVGWIRRYILFHNKRHPAEMGDQEMSRFLTHLAVRSRVSAWTQNQVLAALLFLYAARTNVTRVTSTKLHKTFHGRKFVPTRGRAADRRYTAHLD